MNAPLTLMGEEGQAQGPGGWRLYIRTKRSSTGTVTSSQSTGVQGRQSTTVTVGMVSQPGFLQQHFYMLVVYSGM